MPEMSWFGSFGFVFFWWAFPVLSIGLINAIASSLQALSLQRSPIQEAGRRPIYFLLKVVCSVQAK